MTLGSNSKKDKGLEGTPVDKLTDDIITEIISRVPYKSTCCCKCVSTRWRDLFSHPDHRKKLPQPLAGFFYQGYSRGRFPKCACYFANVSGEGKPLVNPSLAFLPTYSGIDILDCCNGLLLCRCWKVANPRAMDYVVCNPATEVWVVVPATDWSSNVHVARLGFDRAVSSHFHVFEFINEETWGMDDESHLSYRGEGIKALAIYSSKAGAWKHQTVNQDPFVIPLHSKSAFLNGILHLAVCEYLIVAVDVEGDNWWLIDIPSLPHYSKDHVDDIFASQGQLYFVNSSAGSDGSQLQVWVLEDYATKSWTLKHTVSHLQLFRKKYPLDADDFSVISVHPEHDLIFIVGGDKKALMSFDMDYMKRCFIRQLGSDCQVEWPGCGGKTPYLPYVPWFSESLADGH